MSDLRERGASLIGWATNDATTAPSDLISFVRAALYQQQDLKAAEAKLDAIRKPSEEMVEKVARAIASVKHRNWTGHTTCSKAAIEAVQETIDG